MTKAIIKSSAISLLFASGLISSLGEAHRSLSSIEFHKTPFSDIKEFRIFAHKVCALENSGTVSCFGHDFGHGPFEFPPSVAENEKVVGFNQPNVGGVSICWQIDDGKSTRVRCPDGDSANSKPVAYQKEADLWDFLVKSQDPYACRLDAQAELEARKFFAGLNPDMVLIHAHYGNVCAIVGTQQELRCVSCDSSLLANHPEQLWSVPGDTRFGYDLYQVKAGGETRLGSYVPKSNEVVWPTLPVISKLEASDYKLSFVVANFEDDEFAVSLSNWVGIENSKLKIAQFVKDPFYIYGKRSPRPTFKKTIAKEIAIGRWLRLEISDKGVLAISRNRPSDAWGNDQFPRQARLLEKLVNRHSPRNLKIYSAPGGNTWPSDTQTSEELDAPFSEIGCMQVTLPSSSSNPKTRHEVQCLGLDDFGIGGPLGSPENITEQFSAEFEGEVLDYAVGSHVLCGIESNKKGRLLRCFEIDVKGIAREKFTFDRENVDQVAVGYKHVSFVTESDKLIHFDFANPLSEETSPLSGQGLLKIAAYSKHTCVVAEKLKGVLCETGDGRDLNRIINPPPRSKYQPRFLDQGTLGWPVYDLKTHTQLTGAITGRGVELWGGQDGADYKLVQILENPMELRPVPFSK